MVPIWTIPDDAGGTWRRPNTHQYNFPSLKLSHLFLCEPSHEVPHLTLNLLSCAFLQHFITRGVLLVFWVCLWHRTVRLKQRTFLCHLLHLMLRITFLIYTWSLRSGSPCPGGLSWTHRIWLNPPPLCFHSTLASFCHGVHHCVLLFYVYFFSP